MERFDVFVIGGGGTGSSVTLRLANAGLEVAMAERGRLGGECTNYGCVPSKALLKAARVASLGRRSKAFGIDISEVRVNFPGVMARVNGIIEKMLSAGTRPFEEAGATVYTQEARMVGERRIELADGTEIEAAKVVVATGSHPSAPPIEGLQDGFWTPGRRPIWSPSRHRWRSSARGLSVWSSRRSSPAWALTRRWSRPWTGLSR
jgi:pyruvate/2-oxoglutarate dehydrogenase complex dihydrolipoamide dehydrogenase (E3) component